MNREEYLALMKRFNEIASGLPDPETFDATDPDQNSTTKVLLAELRKLGKQLGIRL